MNTRLISASLLILTIGIVGKIIGFFREVALAYFYGAGAITDAYITAITIPGVFLAGVTGAIVLAYIPLASSIESKEEISKTTSNLLNVSSIIIFLLSLLLSYKAEMVSQMFAYGFDENTLCMTTKIATIILPFFVFFSIKDILGAYLQSINSFFFIGVVNIIANVVIILSFVVSDKNITLLALGYALSMIISAIIVFFIAKRKELSFSPVLQIEDPNLKNILKNSIMIFGGSIVLQLNTIVDRNFASTLGTGLMSAMQYANKLNTFFITLFVISIATAIFPTLSQQANDDLPALKKTASGANNIILLFAIPVTVAILLQGNSIVELVFMRGAFSQESADITANALRIYALGLPALSLVEILNREFYALKDTKAPVVCSVVSISTNIILNFLLVKEFGYMGLALSTSIAAIILALLLFYKLHKKIGKIGLQHLLVNCSKMTLAAICMGIIVYFLDIKMVEVLPAISTINRVIALAVTSVAGACVYGILVYLLGIREVRTVIGLLKEKLLQIMD